MGGSTHFFRLALLADWKRRRAMGRPLDTLQQRDQGTRPISSSNQQGDQTPPFPQRRNHTA
jgi:hypothetical protein